MSVFHNNMLTGAAGATGDAPFNTTLIGNSVWLDGSSDGLTKPSSEFDAEDGKEFTLGTWFQLTEFGVTGALFCAGNGSGTYTSLRHDANNKIYFQTEAGSHILNTTAAFRDNAWYHVLVSVDTTQSVTGNRVRMFINGVETALTGTYPALNHAYDFNLASVHEVGDSYENGAFEGYLAQSFMIGTKSIQQDDFAIADFLDTFTFGTNGSQFIPKTHVGIKTLVDAGSDNSFLLNYEPADPTASNALGLDISTYTNNFTSTSMDENNQSGNTPSNTYAVMDVLKNDGTNTTTMAFAEGNTRVTGSGGSDGGAFSTLPLPTTGTTEFQATFNNGDGAVGICCYDNLLAVSTSSSRNVIGGLGVNYNASYGYKEDGNKIVVTSSGAASSSQGAALTTNSVVTVRYDADSNEITFLKDNVVQGSAVSTVAGLTYYAFVARINNYDITLHFDSDKFPHTIGSGNKTINTANLTAPDYQGIDYFDTTLYEGNGTGQRVGDFVPFTDAYTVDKSAMFNSADLRYLARSPSSGSNEKTLTFSTWIKITGVGNSNELAIFTTEDGTKEAQIRISGTSLAAKKVNVNLYNGSSFLLNIETDRTFGGTSSWNNLVVAFDTRAAVASANKVIIYINGVRQSVSGTNLSTDDYDTEFNSTNEHNIGRQTNNAIGEPDFYLAETVLIDGQQLDATSFGQLDTSTNRWVPKDVSGLTFGTNGFYLEYEGTFNSGVAATGAGKDSSGNNNHWAEQNDSGSAWATTDQFLDTPSKNFTTFDPGYSGGGSNVWSEGNTKVKGTDGTNSDSSTTTFGMTGKIVFQFQINTVATDGREYPIVGFITSQAGLSAINASGSIEMGTSSVPGSFGYREVGDFKIPSGTTSTTYSTVSSLQALDADDVIRFEVDTIVGTVRVYFQNEGTGSFSEITGARIDNFSFDPSFGIRPAVSNYSNSIITLQTGGQTTLASVTANYKEINQDNLDDTASKITAWAWIKNRDQDGDDHMLFDRVRGVGNDWHSNQATVQVFNANTQQRFLQRGVQVGSDVEVNTATESYVLWQWLLGDSATTGSTTSPAGTSASTSIVADHGGFSLGTFLGTGSGATVGHGLSAAPELIIIKDLDDAAGDTATGGLVWAYATKSSTRTGDGFYFINGQGAVFDNGPNSYFADTDPSATLITLNGSTYNTDGQVYEFICFRNIPGVQKIGSYVGNSQGLGPYIHTGFKPAWVMIKRSTGTANGDWNIQDSTRNRFNGTSTFTLRANLDVDDEAGSLGEVDFYSDGFRPLADSANANTLSSEYLYLAMAEIAGGGTLPPIYGR